MSLPESLQKYRQAILEAVDDGLSILGDEPVKRAFYFQLEKRAKMTRKEIPNNLDVFHEVLVDMFYQGAIILERRMAREFYEMLNLQFEGNNGWSLYDYVKNAELLMSK